MWTVSSRPTAGVSSPTEPVTTRHRSIATATVGLASSIGCAASLIPPPAAPAHDPARPADRSLGAVGRGRRGDAVLTFIAVALALQNIGSISKTFTWIALMQEVEAGRGSPHGGAFLSFLFPALDL